MKPLEKLKELWEQSGLLLEEIRKAQAKRREEPEEEKKHSFQNEIIDLASEDIDWAFPGNSDWDEDEKVQVFIRKSDINNLKYVQKVLEKIFDDVEQPMHVVWGVHQDIIRQVAEQQGMGPEDEGGE